jgi:hypothetical protein
MKVKEHFNLTLEDVKDGAIDSVVSLCNNNGVKVTGNPTDLSTCDVDMHVEATSFLENWGTEEVTVYLLANSRAIDITQYLKDSTIERIEYRMNNIDWTSY